MNERDTVRIVRESPEVLELEAEWAPGGTPPPAHLHPEQEERFVFQSGRMRAVIDGEERVLEPGDMVVIPPGTVHQMWNEGEEPVRGRWETRPALRTAEWFRRMDALNVGGTRQPPVEDLIKAVQEYGDVFRLA